MTGMLASVNSLDEAMSVMAADVDIVDLKEPAAGALGALPVGAVKTIVAAMNGRCRTSATIGDLPMHPDLIYSATQAMSETGVDYIKIGFFPDGDITGVLTRLTEIADHKYLIAVLFADTQLDLKVVDQVKAAAFHGVMLDTLDKSKGSLTRFMPLSEVEKFINIAKTQKLICGLAGSLKAEDISALLPFQPDYLGFRGALCEQSDRTGLINIFKVKEIRKAIA